MILGNFARLSYPENPEEGMRIAKITEFEICWVSVITRGLPEPGPARMAGCRCNGFGLEGRGAWLLLRLVGKG